MKVGAMAFDVDSPGGVMDGDIGRRRSPPPPPPPPSSSRGGLDVDGRGVLPGSPDIKHAKISKRAADRELAKVYGMG